MTPLAHRIVKELTLPKAKRTFVDHGAILPRLTQAHCFEVSECIELALDLLFHRHGDGDLKDKSLHTIGSLQDVTSFLPAKLTWLEWYKPLTGTREGALLFEDNGRIKFVLTNELNGTLTSYLGAMSLPKIFVTCTGEYSFEYQNYDFADVFGIAAETKLSLTRYYAGTGLLIHVLLSFINTPKVFGRRQHMPHRGLERALLAQQKAIGKFPLHAWTEIKLEVAVPKDLSEEAEHEDHLTGRKALHFCRAHLRHMNGALVFVRPHWRGDASLGIKRSRYNVVPPSTGGGSAHA
jgi:hypothetical protein